MIIGAPAAQRDLAEPPAALLDAVDDRCRELAASAVGQVFKVPANNAEAALRTEILSGARYDTVLSFMCTPQVASLKDYVAAVEQILAAEGWITMVEPSGLRHGAWRGWLTARLRPRSPVPRVRSGDLVPAVRACGLVITDLHRRKAPSGPPAWRQYVVLRARRATPSPPES